MNEQDQRIIERIRKLLRLGAKTNHRAEAEAAIAKAHELAGEAGIAIDSIDADRESVRVTHEAGGPRSLTYSRKLCHGILKRHFSVHVIGDSFSGAVYVGPAVNIAIARHVENFLLRACAAAWSEYAVERAVRNARKATERRRAFEKGFYAGIDNVLSRRPIRNDAADINLAIDAYTRRNFKIVSVPLNNKIPARYDHALYSGVVAGQKTRLDRPVEAAASPLRIGVQ